jgi:iron transport multicopper oxidase
MRLVAMSCDPGFAFSIDGHNFTIIEADGLLTEPLVVDQLEILAGQRYSVVLIADKPVDNYWVRSLPDSGTASFVGGMNSAILRYQGAPLVDPTTVNTTSQEPFAESNLHTLIDPGAPGIPGYGNADINLNFQVNNASGFFYINGVTYKPPTVPVLLQILSGAQDPSQLLPNGSIVVLEANKVVELTLSIVTGPGGPVRLSFHMMLMCLIYILPASHTPSWGKFTMFLMTCVIGADDDL